MRRPDTSPGVQVMVMRRGVALTITANMACPPCLADVADAAKKKKNIEVPACSRHVPNPKMPTGKASSMFLQALKKFSGNGRKTCAKCKILKNFITIQIVVQKRKKKQIWNPGDEKNPAVLSECLHNQCFPSSNEGLNLWKNNTSVQHM